MPPLAMKLLGKLEHKHDQRNLLAARYMGATPPAAWDFEKGRKPLPARTFGNTSYGCCTRASQANALMRLERVEQRRTVVLTDQTVIQAYLALTDGQDNGAHELDALKAWRVSGFPAGGPEADGRLYTIEAFAELDPRSADQLRQAIFTFGGVKLCLGLPTAWQNVEPRAAEPEATAWDVVPGPKGEPWSWGGHSMYADAYDERGLWVVHTWYEGPRAVRQLVTWPAVLRYADEAYSVVDSLDAWRKRPKAERVARPVDVERLAVDLAEATA